MRILQRSGLIAAILLVRLAAPLQAQTSSPFQPPEEKLGIYVLNGGPSLDTGCTYRSGGPLIIRFTLPATVNQTALDSDGRLKNPSKLVSAGLLGSRATIRMPVYDIDSSGGGAGFAPEVDRVSLNGVFKKTLTGINSTWTDDSLNVGIEELRFKSEVSPNAINELRIDIDTANVGNGEFWCMAVDWVATTFDTAAPYVLVHGINAASDSWDNDNSPGVLKALDDSGVLYTTVDLGRNASVVQNAKTLQPLIDAFLLPLKSKAVHVIAHSKGGLDTQGMMALSPAFKLLSLSTLSTPHLGSVAADLSVIELLKANEYANSGDDPKGYAQKYINRSGWKPSSAGPQTPGLNDLTTYAATAAIGAGLRGNVARTYTFGADADKNGDGKIDDDEATPTFDVAGTTLSSIADTAWRVLYEFSEAKTVSITTTPGILWGTRTVITYETKAVTTKRANDLVVAQVSANPSFGIPSGNSLANHSTIKSVANIEKILKTTVPLR